MRKFYSFFCVLFIAGVTAKAQFSASYAPAKWTTTLTTGYLNTASVNTASAPASIIITGSDDPANPVDTDPAITPVDIDYTITAIASGPWSFNWSYHTNDTYNDPQYDIAYVIVNGVATPLSATVGATTQSGTYSGNVTGGTVIGFRLRAVDNSYGDATLTITSFSPPGGILPVKLSAFTAKPQGTKVLLQWTAATEINTSHYEIERSATGTDFTSIGQVAAGVPASEYSFTDQLPLPGVNLYRLRMVDNDGSFSYSAIKAVTIAATTAQALYPNPATTAITITIKAESESIETLQLFNATGVLLREERITLNPGINKKQWGIASLPAGTYWIKARSAGWSQTFVKN
ncbi:MAG: T9SS type A sorting domain-containing protein [Flavisolibacter sp.]